MNPVQYLPPVPIVLGVMIFLTLTWGDRNDGDGEKVDTDGEAEDSICGEKSQEISSNDAEVRKNQKGNVSAMNVCQATFSIVNIQTNQINILI